MGVSVPSRALEAVRPRTKLAHVDDIVAEIGDRIVNMSAAISRCRSTASRCLPWQRQ
jgi:hypothetical protein